jgi:hypothetical protein
MARNASLGAAAGPFIRPLVAVLAVVLVGTAAACSSGGYHGPRLREQGAGNGEAGGSDTIPANQPYLFAIGPLCTTGAPITVTAIRAAQATGGLKVVDWGIRYRYLGDPYDFENPGAEPGPVSQVPGFSTSTRVTVKCNDTVRDDEVDVSVSIPSTRGTMSGVWVYYAGGRTFSQYALAVCTTKVCAQVPKNLGGIGPS